MALWETLLPVFVEAGLGTLSNLSAANESRDARDADRAFEEKKLQAEDKRFAEKLALEKMALMQGAGDSAAANQLARVKAVQEAYRTLINAGLTGREMEIGALGNIINAGQRPLLGGARF